MIMNEMSKDTQNSMLTRTITGIVIAIIGIPCLILGDWFFVALVFFVTTVAVYEMLHVTGKEYPWYIWLTTYIAVYTFVFWVFFQGVYKIAWIDITAPHQFLMADIRISTVGFGFYIAVLLLYSIISRKIDMNDVFYLFAMSLFLGITVQSVLFLRLCPAKLAEIANSSITYASPMETCGLIVYVFAGVFLNDIFAYFTGVLFGKHKMAPVLSPKKTWEGCIGGVVLSTAVTMGMVLIADLCFNYSILEGIIDAEHWYFALIISLVMSISGVIGDLMFSMIKRHYGIKDFGNIFPGHGGVLDRFDSLFIAALLVSIIIGVIFYHPFKEIIPVLMLGL